MGTNMTFEEYFEFISNLSPSSFRFFLEKLNSRSEYNEEFLAFLLFDTCKKNVYDQIPHMIDVGILSAVLADNDSDKIKKVVTELLNK